MIVLVTGASGGFGSVLGQRLLDAGHTVYGTSRAPNAAAPYPMLPLDVSDPATVARCVEMVIEREGRLDAVVNCINEMMIGGVDEQSVDEVRHLYETNVFGVLQICPAVLPVFRKQGGGCIVNMSSLGGLLAVPYMSAYTSAKFALEAISEALYHELRPAGIDVVIMQPVAMAMDRPATGTHLRLTQGVGEGSPSHALVDRMAKDTAASKLTPEMVADRVIAVLGAKKKPLRVPMDRAKALGVVKGIAPQSLIDRLIDGLIQR